MITGGFILCCTPPPHTARSEKDEKYDKKGTKIRRGWRLSAKRGGNRWEGAVRLICTVGDVNKF